MITAFGFMNAYPISVVNIYLEIKRLYCYYNSSNIRILLFNYAGCRDNFYEVINPNRPIDEYRQPRAIMICKNI